MAYSEPGTSPYKYDWQNPNRQTFDFGRVFGRAFSGVFSQFKSLATAVLIVLFITLLLSILSNQQVLKIIGDGTVANAINGPAYWGWSMMGSIPAMFFVLWVQLVVVLTSYAEFTKSNEVSTPLITALRFVLPMFVIALIYSIVSIAGFYLFLIGFIFVWPGWALAGPILVHEKKGIFGSIGEAWSQSRGSKRWIFLLLFLLSLISFIIYIIIIALSTAMVNVNIFAGDPSAILKLSIGQQVLNTLLVGIPSYFVYAIFASGLTAAYVEIKTMKGGAASVGDIFS